MYIGTLTEGFLGPAVSKNIATKHKISLIKTSNVQESKDTMATRCKIEKTKRNTWMQNEAGSLAAELPRDRRI